MSDTGPSPKRIRDEFFRAWDLGPDLDPEKQKTLVRQAAGYVHNNMIDNIMYVQNLSVAQIGRAHV